MITAALKTMAQALAGLAGFVPGWIWAAVVAGAIAQGCVTGHQRDTARRDLAELKASVATTEAMRSEIARAAEAGRRASERQYQADLAARTQRTTHELADLDRTVAALRSSLQHRPERPAPGGDGLPPGGGRAVACTGAQLYRSDAAFLAGEAARGDRIRIQLADCQGRHDAAVTLTRPAIPLTPSFPKLP